MIYNILMNSNIFFETLLNNLTHEENFFLYEHFLIIITFFGVLKTNYSVKMTISGGCND